MECPYLISMTSLKVFYKDSNDSVTEVGYACRSWRIGHSELPHSTDSFSRWDPADWAATGPTICLPLLDRDVPVPLCSLPLDGDVPVPLRPLPLDGDLPGPLGSLTLDGDRADADTGEALLCPPGDLPDPGLLPLDGDPPVPDRGLPETDGDDALPGPLAPVTPDGDRLGDPGLYTPVAGLDLGPGRDPGLDLDLCLASPSIVKHSTVIATTTNRSDNFISVRFDTQTRFGWMKASYWLSAKLSHTLFYSPKLSETGCHPDLATHYSTFSKFKACQMCCYEPQSQVC